MRQFPDYEWTLLSLPARYFAWRIRGNPISFLQEYAAELSQPRDLCLATSMVDLATLKGLVPALGQIPSAVYFHENQFAYPGSENQKQSLEPQMVNLYSALAADRLFFNSRYNRDTFMQGVDALLHSMPDHKPKELSKVLLQKSTVLPVPLGDDDFCDNDFGARPNWASAIPKLLWNHRWEYDKGPELLLEIIRLLEELHQPLRIAIVGQQFRQLPEPFGKIRKILDNSLTLQLEEWGYIQERDAYLHCLAGSDLVLSTALHDFQGLSILEAVNAGCSPVLPDALAYPEWFDGNYLYHAGGTLQDDARSAVEVIKRVMGEGVERSVPDIRFLSWQALHDAYRQKLLANL